jgi:hypothetical protein
VTFLGARADVGSRSGLWRRVVMFRRALLPPSSEVQERLISFTSCTKRKSHLDDES